MWTLPELLHSLDLVGHFAFIAASARIGFEKPHPRIFEWALNQAGVPASQVIHVGDHVDADVLGARGVGIDPVLIDRHGRYGPAEVPDDTPVIASLDELVEHHRRAERRRVSETWRCFVSVPIGAELQVQPGRCSRCDGGRGRTSPHCAGATRAHGT